ncbi:MAG: PEP-CTERM sorting domain-containing protein [Akkermansia muciniphila]|nr:PEP-CTERM sorting domain-containing protein [Akkermansia muciniphila]
MKTTLITLLALSGVSAAATQQENLTQCTLGAKAQFVLTLELKPTAIATLLPNLDTKNEGVIFATVESGSSSVTGLALGKWGDGDVYMQLPSNSSQFAGGLAAGTGSGVTVNGNSLDNSDVSTDIAGLSFTNMKGNGFDWTKVDSAVLTLNHDGAADLSTVKLALTIDGTVNYITGASTNTTRAWDNYGATTTLKWNENFVTSADFKTVPEPATAALSLLAFAGLASRRRRKQA